MKNGRKNDSLNDASLFLDTFNQNVTLKMVLNGQYTVIENLSKTKKRKFSEVYRCKSTISNDYYVLKQLQKTEYNTMEQERLRQEATFSFD
jgi:serine/threonine protein kinase